MAFPKPEPGLDETLTEQAMDDWVDDPPPVMKEPPVRVWPSVVIAIALCIPSGVIMGIAVADYVTVLQALFVTCVLATAATAVILIDRYQGVERP